MSPTALFDLTAGFVYAQVLDACVRLDLFDVLADGPQPTAAIAARIGLTEDETHRLLSAAAALRLAGRRSERRWGLGQLGAAVRGTPGLAEMIRHHRLLYRDMADPVALMRTGGAGTELSKYWSYARTGDPAALRSDEVIEYSALMAASQRMLSDDILDVAPLSGVQTLMDVGGGEGAFLMRAAARSPKLGLCLFDLPSVAAIARDRFTDAGLGSRIATVGGSFKSDHLPDGADAISLVRVLYDHPDDVAASLLSKVFAALPPRGRLIIAEPMDGASGQARMGAAYFGFYLLAMGGGRARRVETFRAMLSDAGFTDIRSHRTAKPMLVSVMSAVRPA